MKVSELLIEGFSGFTVGGSDSAWDAHYTVEEELEKAERKIRKNKMLPEVAVQVILCKEAIKHLTKALKEKGNAYNTHGTLNVAMILNEKFYKFRKFKEWKEFAAHVAKLLLSESERKGFTGEYSGAMLKLVPKLEKLGK